MGFYLKQDSPHCHFPQPKQNYDVNTHYQAHIHHLHKQTREGSLRENRKARTTFYP